MNETKPHTKEAECKQDDGIQYEFHGVNVKDFLVSEAREEIFFPDVIGMEEGKREVRQELFITDEQKEYKRSIGLDDKNFILLYGLPGTGKTYFAMALANELKAFSGDQEIPFFHVVSTKLKEPFIGKTEMNIIALFEFARQFERCVLFMDEFDAIGLSRAKNNGDPTVIPVVNTLLQQLRGFASNPNNLFLAAVNCPYNLDDTLLARMSLRIEVPLPSAKNIEEFLQRKLGEFVAPDVDLAKIAQNLEEKKYSNRDCDSFVQAALPENFNAHSKDASITHIDKDMIDRALSRVESSIEADEVAKLEEFKSSSI